MKSLLLLLGLSSFLLSLSFLNASAQTVKQMGDTTVFRIVEGVDTSYFRVETSDVKRVKQLQADSICFEVLKSGTTHVLSVDARSEGEGEEISMQVLSCYNDFHVSPGTVCAGQNVTLSVTIYQGEPVSYEWKNAFGQVIGTTPTLVVVPTSSTYYTGTVSYNGGCVWTSANLPVIVNPSPSVYIDGVDALCKESTTTLFAVASSGVTFLWNTGSQTSFISNVPAGTYTVTVTDGSTGCSKTATKVVALLPEATITITTNPNPAKICAGEEITLTASGAVNFAWSFNGQIFQYGPSIKVKTSGVYTVTTSGGGNGCTGTASQFVEVLTPPTASISGNLTVCQGQVTTLTATGGGSYQWGPPSYSTSPQVTVGAGNYNVTVTNQFGCKAVASATVTQKSPLYVAIHGECSVCPGEKAWLSASAPDANSYVWSNGATANTIYALPGTYTVTVTDVYGCTGTATGVIQVSSAPVPTVVIMQSNGVITFTATTPALSYLWTSNGSPIGNSSTLVLNTPGVYWVVLTVTYSNGCTAMSPEMPATIAVPPCPPLADFTASPQSICVGGSVFFTNQSSNSPTSLLWSFPGGNPSSSTSQNPVVTYNVAGTYPVTLTATNSGGSHSVTKQSYVTVKGLPTAHFHVVSNVDGNVTFKNNSLNATTYSWSFGDGSVSSATDPTHKYSATGNYSITLTATNECGSIMYQQSLWVTVCTPPSSANFTYNVSSKTVSFYGNGSGSGLTYFWSFGDGTTSYNQNPVHVYTQAGTYTVVLTVSNACGSISCQHTIVIVQAPQVQIKSNKTDMCYGNSCDCPEWAELTSKSLNGVEYQIEWYPSSYIYLGKPGSENPNVVFNKNVDTRDADKMGGLGPKEIFAEIRDLQGNFVETLSLTIWINNCVSGGGNEVFKMGVTPNISVKGVPILVSMPNDEYEVFVCDVLGRTVMVLYPTGDFELDTDSLSAGEYFIHAQNSMGETDVKEIIIQ